MIDFIIVAIVAVALVLVIRKMIKDHKNGSMGCGCGCSSCSHGCAECDSQELKQQ